MSFLYPLRLNDAATLRLFVPAAPEDQEQINDAATLRLFVPAAPEDQELTATFEGLMNIRGTYEHSRDL